MNPIRAAVVVAMTMIVSTPSIYAQAAKVDVTGKWAFNVETAAGSGTPTITFTQDGEKLTGKYSGQLGEAVVPPERSSWCARPSVQEGCRRSVGDPTDGSA